MEQDKITHFTVCALISNVCAQLAVLSGMGLLPALAAGFAIAMLAGIMKEAWDKRRGGVFDWKDIAADTFGASSVVFTGAIFWLS